LQYEPVSAASKPLHEPSAELSSRAAAEDVAPVLVAKASASVPEAKLDHQWLAESLWRRVAELKRYPNSARMNGQEGKVILKAVIRSDGQLADVFVLKSSGYAALDMAAMEAVKLACPLHMKRAIGKPQIVVSLPIVYSLAN
jgi:protein TonB